MSSSRSQLSLTLTDFASRSSTKKRKSTSPSVSQKHSKLSKSNHSATSHLYSSKTQGSNGASVPTDSLNSTSQSLDKNVRPITSASMINHRPSYTQQYSTDVLSGCTSLGADVPTNMHQALFDQHGHSTSRQYSYSTIVEEPQPIFESERLVDDVTVDWLHGESFMTYGYTWRGEELRGDLAGIGSQFKA